MTNELAPHNLLHASDITASFVVGGCTTSSQLPAESRFFIVGAFKAKRNSAVCRRRRRHHEKGNAGGHALLLRKLRR